MPRHKFLRIAISLATAAAFYVLSTGVAHAQMRCQINRDTGCQGCVGKIGGNCCFSYSCSDGSGGTSCSSCQQAKILLRKSDLLSRAKAQEEAILPNELVANNNEVEIASRLLSTAILTEHRP